MESPYLIVNDVLNVGDVQASSGDVRGEQNAAERRQESVHTLTHADTN